MESEDERWEPLLKPVHEKFLGDGALIIWAKRTQQELIRSTFVKPLCDRLRYLRQNFKAIVRYARHDVPIASIPREIRFGLAAGEVLELRRRDRPGQEYTGTCINLASRLQGHCKGLGFIAHASIGLNRFSGEQSGYMWAVAHQIKGFPEEDVIVDRAEFEAINPAERQERFSDYE